MIQVWEINNCQDIEKLREMCHFQWENLALISETLVELSKQQISEETALRDIKKYVNR